MCRRLQPYVTAPIASFLQAWPQLPLPLRLPLPLPLALPLPLPLPLTKAWPQLPFAKLLHLAGSYAL